METGQKESAKGKTSFSEAFAILLLLLMLPKEFNMAFKITQQNQEVVPKIVQHLPKVFTRVVGLVAAHATPLGVASNSIDASASVARRGGNGTICNKTIRVGNVTVSLSGKPALGSSDADRLRDTVSTMERYRKGPELPHTLASFSGGGILPHADAI